MNVGLSLPKGSGNELNLLISYGFEIERKFDEGRADDIKSPYIRSVVKTSVKLRRKTKNSNLQNHLMGIEDSCYAILDNSQKASYYRNLRILARELTSLMEFT